MFRAVSFGFLLLLAAAASCNQPDAVVDGHAGGHDHGSSGVVAQYEGAYPIRIVATVGQVAEMLRRIGGDHVEVTALMGPGIDPHLYKPLPADRAALSAADGIFYVGMHLEGRMSDLFTRMARQRLTYPVTEGLQERQDERLREPPEFAGLYDPHVWHNAALWSDCVADVAEVLAKFDKEHAEQYRSNAEAYAQELAGVDQYCREQIAKVPEASRVLVTAHDAFGYFSDAYGIEVHGLKGISSEDEIDLAHQESLRDMLVERKIPAVFVESSIAPRSIDALIESCASAGHELKKGGELYADVLAPPGEPGDTYAGMMRHNADTIVNALSGE